MFVPLQELENAAPGTWYVNVLAVLLAHRNQGLGSELLRFADETGRGLGLRGMSVMVSNANLGARRLYEKHGYGALDRRKMIKEGWSNEGEQWMLLTKPL
jgi:ribosomal protein S18 acetylase RimI-like enzyme